MESKRTEKIQSTNLFNINNAIFVLYLCTCLFIATNDFLVHFAESASHEILDVLTLKAQDLNLKSFSLVLLFSSLWFLLSLTKQLISNCFYSTKNNICEYQNSSKLKFTTIFSRLLLNTLFIIFISYLSIEQFYSLNSQILLVSVLIIFGYWLGNCFMSMMLLLKAL